MMRMRWSSSDVNIADVVLSPLTWQAVHFRFEKSGLSSIIIIPDVSPHGTNINKHNDYYGGIHRKKHVFVYFCACAELEKVASTVTEFRNRNILLLKTFNFGIENLARNMSAFHSALRAKK